MKSIDRIKHLKMRPEFEGNLVKEELKICAKLNGLSGFGVAMGYMVFDESMPEFQKLKDAFIQASQEYLARISGDVEMYEREVFDELKRKFANE